MIEAAVDEDDQNEEVEDSRRILEMEIFPDEAADNVALRLARATAPCGDSILQSKSGSGNGISGWFWMRRGNDTHENNADVRSQEVPKILRQARRALLTQLHLLQLKQRSFNSVGNPADVFVPPALRRSGSPSSKQQRRQQQEAEELIAQLRYASNAEYGMVLLHQLLADTLRQLSTSASSVTASRDYFAAQRFFLHAVHKDFVVETSTSSDVAKYASIALITCINLGALFFVALKGIQRGSVWQRSFLSVCLLEWLVDVAFMETMEVVWVDFFLPGFVLSEVQAGVQQICRLSEAYIERLLHPSTSIEHGSNSSRSQLRNRVQPSSISVSSASSCTSSDGLSQTLARHKSMLPESQLALSLIIGETQHASNRSSANFSNIHDRAYTTNEMETSARVLPSTLPHNRSDLSSEQDCVKTNGNHNPKRKRLHMLYLLSLLPLELHVFFTRTVATVFLGAMVYTWFSLKKVMFLRLLWMALLILVVMFGFIGAFVWILHYQTATVKRRVSVFMPAFIPPPAAQNKSLSTSSLSTASSSTFVNSSLMLFSPVSSTSTELLVRSTSLLCMPTINETDDEDVIKGVASDEEGMILDEEKAEERKSSSLSFGSSSRWSSLLSSSSSASIAAIDQHPFIQPNVSNKEFQSSDHHEDRNDEEAKDAGDSDDNASDALRRRQSGSDHPTCSGDGAVNVFDKDSVEWDGGIGGGSSVWTVSTRSSTGRSMGDVHSTGSDNHDDSISAFDRQVDSLESFLPMDQNEVDPDFESKLEAEVEVEVESEDSFHHHSYGCRRRRLSSTSAGTLDIRDIMEEEEDDDASLYSLHLSLSSSRATSSRRTSISTSKTRHLQS